MENLSPPAMLSELENVSREVQGEVPDFSDLPDLIWIKVLNMLDMRDRYQISLTCCRLQQVSNTAVWKSVTLDLSQRQDLTFQNNLDFSVEGYLSPFQEIIVKKFGHTFQHVEVVSSSFDLRPESFSLLVSLAEHNLKSLTLSTHCEYRIFQFPVKTTKPNLSSFMDAVCPKVPNVYLNVEMKEGTGDLYRQSHVDILEKLLKCPKSDSRCKHLNSLNFTPVECRYAVEKMAWRDVGSYTPTAVLISKFPSLQHLQLSVFNVSDALLEELSNSSRHCFLHSLTIEFVGQIYEESGEKVPQLSSEAWSKLAANCPNTEVWCKINTAGYWPLKSALKPEVPLVGIIIFCGSNDTRVYETHLVTELFSETLRSFEYIIGDILDYVCGEKDRLPVKDVVQRCCRLQHLKYGGYIDEEDIVNMAMLDRQWKTFQIQENKILVSDQSLSGRHVLLSKQPEDCQRKVLDELKQKVSKQLGFTWKPSKCERRAYLNLYFSFFQN